MLPWKKLDSVQNPTNTVTVQSATADLLRSHGVQVTAQRIAVLQAVSSAPHSTADGVHEIALAELGAISRQAVYDALGTLVAADLVRRIQPAGSPARFEDRTGDNHHHLACRQCHALVDVDCAAGYAPCLTASDDNGFAIDEAEVVYWGLCPRCRPDASSGDPTPAADAAPART